MNLFFNNWESLFRIFVIGVLGYLSLILILRISGTRTLSKMNSFDFVVTITLGSTFASAILQKSVSLADVIFAFSLLVGLQYFLTFLTVKYPIVDKLVKDDPILLFANDKFLKKSMMKAHVSEGEVLASIRKQGISDVNQVMFVVLETNGEIIAVKKDKASEGLERRLSLSSQVTPDPKKYS